MGKVLIYDLLSYMIPLFFQFTRGDTALDAGVRLLPLIALLVFAIITNGALLAKFGYYMVSRICSFSFAFGTNRYNPSMNLKLVVLIYHSHGIW